MMSAVGSPRARALSAALRVARENSGWSARRLADRLSIDQSHLSRIESGKRVPSLETTAMILASLRTAPAERERILDLARNAGEPNWLAVGMAGIPQQLAGVMESERAASAITAWHPCLIPGLLQTTAYTRSVIMANAALEQHSSSEVESRVMIKAVRGESLTKPQPVRFNALISESALREPITEPAAMIEQLRHLISMSGQSNIAIRIVPRGTGWHPGLAGPFVLYEFDDSAAVVHVEHHVSGAFNQNADDVALYRKAIGEIDRRALNSAESVGLIGQIIVEEWSETRVAEKQS